MQNMSTDHPGEVGVQGNDAQRSWWASWRYSCRFSEAAKLKERHAEIYMYRSIRMSSCYK